MSPHLNQYRPNPGRRDGLAEYPTPLMAILKKLLHLLKKREGKERSKGDFPGGPVVKTPCFQCRGHRFDSWSGN